MRAGALLLLAVAGAALVGGCTAESELELDEDALAELQASEGPPIYWVGRSFEGYPLTAAERIGREVTLVYGDCEIEDQGWFEDGGCPLPVDIQLRPIRSNNPNVYRRMNGEPWGCGRPIRGVPTSRSDAIRLYTGEWEITLYATSRAQTERLAQALHPLNEPGEPGELLPPPAIDVAWGQGCEGARTR
jgi:hypothetical protein